MAMSEGVVKTLSGSRPDVRVLVVRKADGRFMLHIERWRDPDGELPASASGWVRRVFISDSYESVDLAEDGALKAFPWLAD